MSSFMVSNETLCIISHYLARKELPPYMNYAIYYERGDVEKIYEALRDLNHKALAVRYGEKANEMYDLAFYKYETPSRNFSNMEMVVRLSCFLYQCNEGTINNNELYLALERLCGELATSVILEIIPPRTMEGWWK